MGKKEQKLGESVPRITRTLLRTMPLPSPDDEGGKKERGRALIVAGAAELIGAPALAATAVLRAGAGKARIATCRSIAPFVGLAIPEARVFALQETRGGGISAMNARKLGGWLNEAEALLIGPGMIDESAVAELLRRLLPRIPAFTTVIIDATALKPLGTLASEVSSLNGKVILTPHAEEMAAMLSLDKSEVLKHPLETAYEVSSEFNAVVVLKGATTYITTPDGSACVNTAGNVGLGTTGSGDVLAGIITGLCARGATPFQAAAWGVFLHAKAGDRLADSIGLLGYLAREIPAEIPKLLQELER
jgi:ADP-dependent NAD(P)H-hydrate dehydratase